MKIVNPHSSRRAAGARIALAAALIAGGLVAAPHVLDQHAFAAATAPKGDYRVDLANTGQEAAFGPVHTPSQVFSVKPTFGGTTFGVELDASGNVVFGNTSGTIYSYSPTSPTGTKKWQFPASGSTGTYGSDSSSAPSNPVVSADGNVYIGNDNGNLYQINATTGAGAAIFGTTTSAALQMTPKIGQDNSIYIGGSDGNFYHLIPAATVGAPATVGYTFAASGSTQPSGSASPGTSVAPFRFYGEAALDTAGNAYAASSDGSPSGTGRVGTLYKITPAGAGAWKAPLQGEPVGAELLATNPSNPAQQLVIVVDSQPEVVAFDAATGAQVWRYVPSSASSFSASPALSKDGKTVYAINSSDTLYGVDVASGAAAAGFGTAGAVAVTGGSQSAPVVDSAGTLYVGSNNGTLYGYSPSGAQLFGIASGNVSSKFMSAAIASDGTIYAGGTSGIVRGFVDTASQTSAAQTGAAQTSAAQTSAAQTGAAQTSAAQTANANAAAATSAAQTGAAQTSAAQTSAAQAAQTSAAQTSAAQTSAAQAAQTGAAQTAAAQTSAAQTAGANAAGQTAAAQTASAQTAQAIAGQTSAAQTAAVQTAQAIAGQTSAAKTAAAQTSAAQTSAAQTAAAQTGAAQTSAAQTAQAIAQQTSAAQQTAAAQTSIAQQTAQAAAQQTAAAGGKFPNCQLYVLPNPETVQQGGSEAVLYKALPGAPITTTIGGVGATYPTTATLYNGAANQPGVVINRNPDGTFTFKAGPNGRALLDFPIPGNAPTAKVTVQAQASETCAGGDLGKGPQPRTISRSATFNVEPQQSTSFRTQVLLVKRAIRIRTVEPPTAAGSVVSETAKIYSAPNSTVAVSATLGGSTFYTGSATTDSRGVTKVTFPVSSTLLTPNTGGRIRLYVTPSVGKAYSTQISVREIGLRLLVQPQETTRGNRRTVFQLGRQTSKTSQFTVLALCDKGASLTSTATFGANAPLNATATCGAGGRAKLKFAVPNSYAPATKSAKGTVSVTSSFRGASKSRTATFTYSRKP